MWLFRDCGLHIFLHLHLFDLVLSGILHDIYEHLLFCCLQTRGTCIFISFFFFFFLSQSGASINESKGKIYTWRWEATISRIHRKWICIKVCHLLLFWQSEVLHCWFSGLLWIIFSSLFYSLAIGNFMIVYIYVTRKQIRHLCSSVALHSGNLNLNCIFTIFLAPVVLHKWCLVLYQEHDSGTFVVLWWQITFPILFRLL